MIDIRNMDEEKLAELLHHWFGFLTHGELTPTWRGWEGMHFIVRTLDGNHHKITVELTSKEEFEDHRDGA